MLVTSDLHWAAGFLEGEGAFMAIPMRGKYKLSQVDWVRWNPVVDAAQVNAEPLLKLQRIFGGKIYKQTRPQGNRQQAHSWRLHGKAAVAFMLTVWTLMSDRRRSQIASTEGPVALSKRHGVSPTLISNIRSGRAWKHIPRHNRQVA
jgi:hypothetical protein